MPRSLGELARGDALLVPAQLRATIEDDVALLQAARLGEQLTLIVEARVTGKGFSLVPQKAGDEVLTYAATVKIESVSAAELA